MRTEQDISENIDFIKPFEIMDLNLRGRITKLTHILDDILGKHHYPPAIEQVLAELIVTSSLLAHMIKFEGVFTLQASGDGALSFVVVDVTSKGMIRAYAKFNRDKLTAIGQASPNFKTLLGKGYLTFTVLQDNSVQTYQGMVELVGESIATSIESYFVQSEQIPTLFKVAAVKRNDHWFATGLMLQRLPASQSEPIVRDLEDDWRRAKLLMQSLTYAEMTDEGLQSNGLLYRLFHEEGIKIFDEVSVYSGCRCSRQKIENVLKRICKKDFEDLMIGGIVKVDCEFCTKEYQFREKDIEELQSKNE